MFLASLVVRAGTVEPAEGGYLEGDVFVELVSEGSPMVRAIIEEFGRLNVSFSGWPLCFKQQLWLSVKHACFPGHSVEAFAVSNAPKQRGKASGVRDEVILSKPTVTARCQTIGPKARRYFTCVG